MLMSTFGVSHSETTCQAREAKFREVHRLTPDIEVRWIDEPHCYWWPDLKLNFQNMEGNVTIRFAPMWTLGSKWQVTLPKATAQAWVDEFCLGGMFHVVSVRSD